MRFAAALNAGAEIDQRELVQMAADGCEHKAPTACELGGSVALRLDHPDAPVLAGSFFEAGCTLGSMRSCAVLGNLAIDGRGVAKDRARAFELWRQACDGGEGEGCASLGFYVERDGKLDDALKLYERACEAGASRSCRTLGSKYADGEGVTADRDRAMTYLDRACKAGDTLGCGYQRDLAARVFPLERLTVRSFTIGHEGLQLSKAKRSKAAAKKLADAAVRELGRGASFETVAKKYADPDPYAKEVGREGKFFRLDRAKADAKQFEFTERLFGLKAKTAYASENPSFGFVVFYRP